MLQAFIITLREGVEASLIVGIIFAYLSKIGRSELKRTVFYAIGAAVAASVLAAVIISKLNINSDVLEGWVMLAAAAFVVSMIWFMHRTARSMRGDIEAKIARYTGGEASVSRLGLFFFVFLLVFREGVETVLILSAVSLNSSEILSFTGTVLGLAVAIVFGVLFIRGSVRINLQRFFRVTTVILYFVTFQLVVSGLHELSENGVLPSSTAEMRLIGPIVRNDLFFFVTMLALAGLMILLERKRSTPTHDAAALAALDPAARRKLAWSQRREKMWMSAVVGTSFLFIFLSTAEFIYAKSSTALSATTAVTLTGQQVTVPLADVNDDKLHRYGVHITDPSSTGPNAGRSVEIRFLLFKKPDGNIVSVADACSICGPVGFYIGAQGITCKMCASPLVPQSMGVSRRLQPHPPQIHPGRRHAPRPIRRPPAPRPHLRALTMAPPTPTSIALAPAPISPAPALLASAPPFLVVILSAAKNLLLYRSLPTRPDPASVLILSTAKNPLPYRTVLTRPRLRSVPVFPAAAPALLAPAPPFLVVILSAAKNLLLYRRVRTRPRLPSSTAFLAAAPALLAPAPFFLVVILSAAKNLLLYRNPPTRPAPASAPAPAVTLGTAKNPPCPATITVPTARPYACHPSPKTEDLLAYLKARHRPASAPLLLHEAA